MFATTKIRHVDFYHDEWLAGTATLDVVDVGVYITACAMIYSRGGPIQLEDLKRFVRCHAKVFANAFRRLVQAGKLTLTGTEVCCKRCANELETARKRVATWSQNGSKGGRPRKEINEVAKPSGSYARAELPTIRSKKDSDAYASGADAPSPPPDEPVTEPIPEVDHVKEIFARGKEALGQKSGSLLGQMRRRYGDIAVIDAIVACEDVGPSNPIPFFVAALKQGKRLDEKRKLSPVEKLHLGGWLAAQDYDRKHGISRDCDAPDFALLDSR